MKIRNCIYNFVLFNFIMFTSIQGFSKDKGGFSEKMQDAPAWSSFVVDENKDKSEDTVKILGEAAENLPVEEARKCIISCLQERTDDKVGAWSKVYVFNRLYFNVPEWEEKKSLRFFGGWIGIPEKDGKINVMFPLEKNANGRIFLSKNFGGYSGPDYDGLGEFDYFLKKYGLRKNSTIFSRR
ncbi:MAG: hypothetical protein SFY92_09180 [Verrucomicrobiae bacterium]|nr:hypothetical protein [Verrucomicrobiae bacterium]